MALVQAKVQFSVNTTRNSSTSPSARTVGFVQHSNFNQTKRNSFVATNSKTVKYSFKATPQVVRASNKGQALSMSNGDQNGRLRYVNNYKDHQQRAISPQRSVQEPPRGRTYLSSLLQADKPSVVENKYHTQSIMDNKYNHSAADIHGPGAGASLIMSKNLMGFFNPKNVSAQPPKKLIDETPKFQNVQNVSYEVSNDSQIKQDPEYWVKNMDIEQEEVHEEKPEKGKKDWKKGLLIFLVAGPKASIVFGGVMLQKVLASYGIILTKQMMGMFCLNLGVSIALLMLIKKQFPVTETASQKNAPKMVKYFKSGVATVMKLALITTSVYSLQYCSSHMSLIFGLEHGGALTAVKIFTDLCLVGSVALILNMKKHSKPQPPSYA